jgi:hypothetical protein
MKFQKKEEEIHSLFVKIRIENQNISYVLV